MNISKELKGQLDRLALTGAFRLSKPQKQELSLLIDQIGGRPYTNLDCGTCTRDAMHQLNAFMKQKETIPVLQKVETLYSSDGVKNMKMVKGIHEMTYQELKKEAKRRGIKAGRVSKVELIKLLENGQI